MDICEKVEFLKKIKGECVEAIRLREPDAATSDEGIDNATVAWVARVSSILGSRIASSTCNPHNAPRPNQLRKPRT